ncbi:MAG: 50S ribosomal protein L11 methyltransferase [Thermodesulfobacteriota bacterium]|nr:50S ribosomal protein L11 methyltransferase [Thermodesulfobacteriota bacterium]
MKQQNPFKHRSPRSWQKFTVQISSKTADPVASFLSTLTGSGVEYNLAESGNKHPKTETIIGYLPEDRKLDEKKGQLHLFLNHLASRFPDSPPVLINEESILEEDWSQTWKTHFKPIRLTKRIVIKPSWEDYDADDDQIVIDIDPGMAFGTGHHASTRLALELIEESFANKIPQSVLDVGTGTSILGLACGLLGAESVLGIDNDPDAVAAARENIKINHLQHIMSADNVDIQTISGLHQLILANITHDVLTKMAPILVKLLQTSGTLILAGILEGTQADSIETLYKKLGLTVALIRSQDEWVAFQFLK